MDIKEEKISKDNTSTRIIEGASALFFRRGIKCVKMDDIARELGVSKRTIYECFTDKEQLLSECLRYIYRRMLNEVREKIRKSSQNTLDAILILYSSHFDMLKLGHKDFFSDLQHYPSIKKERERKEISNNQKFKAWMQQGIKEGLFREDLNADVLIYILKRDLELIVNCEEFKEYSADELGKNFILFYLRGIATPKGQNIIEDFIKEIK